ncbi:MAG: hypothetical protein M1422_02500 [Candidatus Thermoplasmatota archaeon]|nr:hypothetical protein [Candidatus Thermoplasmatota archaeon]MCL5253380.1 hypothetical protein [Candidatus Thermoplasmatota archaeon]
MAEKTGQGRATVAQIRKTINGVKSKVESKALAEFEGYQETVAKKIACVGELANDDRTYALHGPSFEKAGIALVDDNYRSTMEVVSKLKQAGWNENNIRLGASWLANMMSNSVFKNMKRPDGNMDSSKMGVFF